MMIHEQTMQMEGTLKEGNYYMQADIHPRSPVRLYFDRLK